VNLFLLHFSGNTVFHAVSCLLGCLPELSNDSNQPSTSYALMHHDCFNVLTNIDLLHSFWHEAMFMHRTLGLVVF